MTLKGWVIYNGMLTSPKFIDFARMIQEAAEEKGHHCTIVKNNDLLSYLQTNTLHLIKHEDLALPDYVVFTDKDIYLARQLEKLGIRVFNKANTIAISDDKIATYQELAIHNIPIPDTIIAPNTFTDHVDIDEEYMSEISKKLSFPLVIKEAFGSFGEQVYLISSMTDLKVKMTELRGKAFVFQQFIQSSYGQDLRLQVVGNEVVAAMKRLSTNDFRANVTTGGSMIAYKPTVREKEIALKATRALEADFAGIDLLFGEAGEPIVCEVNSNAHIRNLLTCTGINSAPYIIDYIEEDLGEA